MLPESLLVMVLPLALGWMGFTWRRTEAAHREITGVINKIDTVELKMAEQYLTKADFELSMERLFKGFERIEKKIDFHVYDQSESIRDLKRRLKDRGDNVI